MGRQYSPRKGYAYQPRPQYKVCPDCGVNKKLEKRYWNKNGTYKRKFKAYQPEIIIWSSRCKLCTRKLSKLRREHTTHTTQQNEYQRRSRKGVYLRSRLDAWSYLAAKGCEDCGERDPRLLEFDHLDPSTKKANVSSLIARGRKWSGKAIQAEVAKCRILCVRCHRLHTVEQLKYFQNPELQQHLQELREEYDFQ